MKSVEHKMNGNLNVDDADRLLEALETVTHGTLEAWAQKLSAPRMMALLNATASDGDPEDETELIERIVTQADFEAMATTPSGPNSGAPAAPRSSPTPTRSLRRVPRFL
jgi:hypothetical protein